MSDLVKWSGNPLDWSVDACSRRGTFVAEMPALVKGLEVIEGEVVATLEGGSTIPLGSFIDNKPRGPLQ